MSGGAGGRERGIQAGEERNVADRIEMKNTQPRLSRPRSFTRERHRDGSAAEVVPPPGSGGHSSYNAQALQSIFPLVKCLDETTRRLISKFIRYHHWLSYILDIRYFVEEQVIQQPSSSYTQL